jgi:hypothetical protein
MWKSDVVKGTSRDESMPCVLELTWVLRPISSEVISYTLGYPLKLFFLSPQAVCSTKDLETPNWFPAFCM